MSNILYSVLAILAVFGLQAGADIPVHPSPAGPTSPGGGGPWKGAASIPSAPTPSYVIAKLSPVGIPLLTSWMKYLSDSFKMGDRYKMVEVLQRTPSEMILQWKRRRTGGGSKGSEKLISSTKAAMPTIHSTRPKQTSTDDTSSSSASAAAHLLLDSAESVFHHVGDGTVTQEDIEALEDFGLQAASFTIVVVVAAMFGAFLSWAFRIAYIKWRRRLVARLPIVRYTGPGWEAVPVAKGSRPNSSAPSVSASSATAEYSEEEERMVLLRSAVEQSLTQLALAVTSGTDPEVNAFLSYLSTNATHVFDELQSLSHHASDIVNTVLHREGCRTSTSTSSSLSASSAALLLLQWDLRRLVAAAGIITSEFEAFLQTSSSRAGERRSKKATSNVEPKVRQSSKPAEVSRSEFALVLSHLRQSLVQYRNELALVAADSLEPAQGPATAEGASLLDHGLQLHPRRSGDETARGSDQVGAAFCPVCMDKFARGETLSQLPCRHLYHTRCIVPWLMKQSLTCPLCKQIV